jgi:hypothetical protein
MLHATFLENGHSEYVSLFCFENEIQSIQSIQCIQSIRSTCTKLELNRYDDRRMAENQIQIDFRFAFNSNSTALSHCISRMIPAPLRRRLHRRILELSDLADWFA